MCFLDFSYTALIICGCLILVSSVVFASKQIRLRRKMSASRNASRNTRNTRQNSRNARQNSRTSRQNEYGGQYYDNYGIESDSRSWGDPDILSDLPPAYDTVVGNHVFYIDSDSVNEENQTSYYGNNVMSIDDSLPSYEDIENGLTTNSDSDSVHSTANPPSNG